MQSAIEQTDLQHTLAPIALFVYNRPEHTRRTVEALADNPLAKDSEIFIFSDAAKSTNATENVQKVRAYIATITGFKAIHITEREQNWGLANSIIDGVSRLCDAYGKVIVLEDDLIALPGFLAFMNSGLVRYEDCPEVMQISGFAFPISVKSDEAFFLPLTTSWGWATWNRAWKKFDVSAKSFYSLKTDRALRKKFDLNNSYPYYQMLKSQMAGKIDSWAIRWYLSVFINAGRVLYPPHTLILNTGMDGSGTHCKQGDFTYGAGFIENGPVSFPQEIAATDHLIEIEKILAAGLTKSFARRILGFFK